MGLEFGFLVGAYGHVLVKHDISGSIPHLNIMRAGFEAQLRDMVRCTCELAVKCLGLLTQLRKWRISSGLSTTGSFWGFLGAGMTSSTLQSL